MRVPVGRHLEIDPVRLDRVQSDLVNSTLVPANLDQAESSESPGNWPFEWIGTRVAMLTLLLMAIWGLGMSAHADNLQEDTESGVFRTPVTLTQVQSQSVSLPIRATGQTVALEQVPLGFKIGGLVKSLTVDVGSVVKSGQLLARLDSSETDAAVAQARAQLLDAERQQQRLSTLQGQDAVSIQSLQGLDTQVAVARENLRVAEFNQRHSRISSPVAGRVLARAVEQGQWVQSGQPVLVVMPADPGWGVRALLTDIQRQSIALGDTARVILNPDTPQARALNAHVRELPWAAAQGLFPVELAFDEEDKNLSSTLMAGLTVRIEITPASGTRMTPVPVEALVSADGQRGELMLAKSTGEGWIAEPREIGIEALDGATLWVNTGLEDNPVVITRGAELVVPGAPVQATDANVGEYHPDSGVN